MDDFVRWVIRRRWAVLGACLLLSAVSVFSMSNGVIATSVGNMFLGEGESANEFVSYNIWNIEITRGASGLATMTIPQEKFLDLRGNRSRTFYAEGHLRPRRTAL